MERTKKFRKGEQLLRAGDKAACGYRVLNGCLKSYVIDESGREHILQFAPEDWTIADIGSLQHGTPAIIFIDAIEDTEVALLENPIHELPEGAGPEHYGQQLRTLFNHIVALNKRLINLLSATAEQRYLDFVCTYPALALRLPQKLIASYLGITPEFLSKIRGDLTRRQRQHS